MFGQGFNLLSAICVLLNDAELYRSRGIISKGRVKKMRLLVFEVA